MQLVDEFGAEELERLWPGASRTASVVVDPSGAYALVRVNNPDDVSSTELPTSAAVWPLGDDHVFVRSFPNASVPETLWIVDLSTAERAAVAVGTEPRLSADRSTVALTARLESESWVVVMPLEDPAAGETLVPGTAIDWIQR